MRAVRRLRAARASGTVRSVEHDAAAPEADHAERGRRGNPEGGHRRGNADPAHGWLAESAQRNHAPRPGSPRNSGRFSPHASLTDDFTVYRHFVAFRTTEARWRVEPPHVARGNGLA